MRPICNVLIWGRDPQKAEKLAKRLNRRDFRVDWTDDLEAAVRGAHIITCATLSKEPLIRGDWLQPGQHVDLVGAFRPDMRETDDAVMRRVRVFVDTRAGATKEGGDIVQAVESGALAPDDIAGDLFEMTRGERSGRRFYDQITLQITLSHFRPVHYRNSRIEFDVPGLFRLLDVGTGPRLVDSEQR